MTFSSVHQRSWILIFFLSFFLSLFISFLYHSRDLRSLHLVCLMLFSILEAMHSAYLELACTKQLKYGTCSAAICFSKTIFDLVLEATNFVF